MTSEGDLWRMVVSHEREFGGLVARQNATDANVARIGEAVAAGFAEHKQAWTDAMRASSEGMAREMAHVRGEIGRIDDAYRQQREFDEREAKRRREEEEQRTQQLITELKESAARSDEAASRFKRDNRRILYLVVLIGALASAFIENAPNLLSFGMRIWNAIDQ